jgi:predicted DNA-binding protein (MmcQ/YjbR family)
MAAPTDVMSRAAFEGFAASLVAVTFVEQWGGLVAKVGGKVFAVWGGLRGEPGSIVFKVAETSFEILTALEGVNQAPYFAKGKWVAVGPAALPEGDVKQYLAGSHALVAVGLTKVLQRELGLLPPR